MDGMNDAPSLSSPNPSSSLNSCPILESEEKLNKVAKALWPIVVLGQFAQQHDSTVVLQTRPCTSYKDTIQYRCRCNFQIIQNESDLTLQYATRQQQQAVPLPNQEFPIANRRIQRAMRGLMELLHEPTLDDEMKLPNTLQSPDGDYFRFHAIRQHLTSASFASSWYDDDDETGISEEQLSDCAMTLHYDHPILPISVWKIQAQRICQRLHLAQFTGRSKGQVIVVTTRSSTTTATTAIRDMLWLHPPSQDDNWKVEMGRVPTNDESRLAKQEAINSMIPVNYYKHEAAFCHPNGRVMLRALEWMLNRIEGIVAGRLRGGGSSTNDDNHACVLATPALRLVELYSGNGAHTMALAKSGLLSEICAVELDERLVRACQVNLARNELRVGNSQSNASAPTDTATVASASAKMEVTKQASVGTRPMTTQVRVIQGDAGAWARKARELFSQQASVDTSTKSSNGDSPQQMQDFDILLVDPPRQGLDAAVCQWALQEANPLNDILYISCGHEALVRDLKMLVSAPATPVIDPCHAEKNLRPYQVVDCQVLDLFPRTSAVETLVHLSRVPRQGMT